MAFGEKGDLRNPNEESIFQSFSMEGESGGGGSGGFPCRITGVPVGSDYPIDIHRNGRDATKTGEGYIEVFNVHMGQVVSISSWVMGFDSSVRVIGDES